MRDVVIGFAVTFALYAFGATAFWAAWSMASRGELGIQLHGEAAR